MPVPPKASAAKPVHGSHFDPWNSVSTGHQIPDNQPGTGWRESRNRKLNNQYQSSRTGGERLSDTWGAGSEHYDEKKKALIPPALRQRASNSVLDMLVKPGRMKDTLPRSTASSSREMGVSQAEALMESRRREDEARESGSKERPIFEGLVVFVNGSTFPLVSDHALKQMLTKNGAQMSMHVARRRVTHVIIGKPARGGGGLAGGKFEKEIKKIGGCGIKFVGPEWVLESIKAGKRLPEARFTAMKIAPKAQGSVHNLFTTHQGPGS
ncbi:unnamed protein product [Clonostachys solani]|uniref:BRCT domain-containing protein n=1 Tax=Clonostachys solani TaxID=160281 RepID=A0A9N9ZCJ2_9HYPO|nr:unnamed protein product [Clonostachys solani]